MTLAACAKPAPATPPSNSTPLAPAPPAVSKTLDGPFRDVAAVWRDCRHEADDARQRTTTLAETTLDRTKIALLEYRVRMPAAGCAITVTTPKGLYVGPEFLCAADRSDERIALSDIGVTAGDRVATFRYTTSYERNINGVWRPPAVSHHVIRCKLSEVVECTSPDPLEDYGAARCY